MLGDTTPPRRRKLPMLGMTTVGLAVGAGSLGLYRGAAAVPLGPPDQPTWTTAEVRAPAPRPPADPVTQAAAESPAMPLLPTLPTPEAAAPPKPPEPTPWPPSRPAEVLPSPAPVMPVSPIGPLLPLMPSLGTPDLVKPVEVAPIAVIVAEPEVAPPPRQLPKAASLEEKPAAPPAQPVQLAPPVRPIAPVPPEFPLPTPLPGFNVKISPEVTPSKATPGALTSLRVEPPGDAPVIPTRQALKSAALGVALAVSPVTAADPPTKADVAKPDAAKVEAPKDEVLSDLKRQVEALRKDTNLEKDFRKLTDDAVMGKLNKESGKTEPGLISKFNELDDRLKRMEKALEKLDASKFEEAVARLEKKLDAANNSTTTQKPDATAKAADPTPKAMPGPTTPPAAAASPAILGPKATVRIVNEYPVGISMMVNGTSHRIEPNASKSVEVQAGSYTYELIHSGSQATTAAIKENDSVTLRIK